MQQGNPNIPKLKGLDSLKVAPYAESKADLGLIKVTVPAFEKPIIIKGTEFAQKVHLDSKCVLVGAPVPATTLLQTTRPYRFVIPKKSCGLINGARLRIHGRNTSGANAVVMEPTPLWFSRYELCNVNNTLIQRMTGQAWFTLMTAIYSDEQMSTIAPLFNSTNAWGGAVSLALSTNRDYTLPLLGSVLNRPIINLMNAEEDLVLNLYPVGDGSVSSGTTPLFTITGIDLELDVEIGTPTDAKRSEEDAKSPKVALFLDVIDQPYLTQTLTLSQTTNLSLANFTGKCAMMSAQIRASGATSASNGLGTYTALENATFNDGTIDVLNPTGQSLIANQPLLASDIRYSIFSKHFPNSKLTLNLPVYHIPFCHSMKKAIEDPSIDGCLIFNGDGSNLALKPSASWSTTTYDVLITACIWRYLVIENGKFKAYNA